MEAKIIKVISEEIDYKSLGKKYGCEVNNVVPVVVLKMEIKDWPGILISAFRYTIFKLLPTTRFAIDINDIDTNDKNFLHEKFMHGIKSLLINSAGNACYVMDVEDISLIYHYIFRFDPTKIINRHQWTIRSAFNYPWGMVFGSSEDIIISICNSIITLTDQINSGGVIVPSTIWNYNLILAISVTKTLS
jgi:hypothetical protein